jgi:hypothetical protein
MHSGNAHQRLRWRVLAVAVVIAALAAACGGGGSEPGPVPTARPSTSQPPTVATSSSTPTPTFVNTTPGEQPPVRPADELSDAGVKAFAEYWVKTLDWAYATMDTTLLKSASDPMCEVCASSIQTIDEGREDGNIFLGSRFTLQFVTPVPAPADTTTRTVSIALAYSELRIIGPDGSTTSGGPGDPAMQLLATLKFAPRWVAADITKIVIK